MKTLKHRLFLVFVLIQIAFPAVAAIDNDAQTVQLRKSCMENNAALDNCFQTTNALASWMADTRHPNKSAPLKVEVGPGRFGRIAVICDAANNYTGYISFNGAGPDQTKFVFAAGGAPPFGVLRVEGCTGMSFANLQITSGKGGIAYGYIEWVGGGTSHWNNVVVIVSARGWQESACGPTKGQHYWFSSRFVTHAISNIGTGYVASCDDSWFFGSEITFTTEKLGQFGGGSSAAFTTLVAQNGVEVHVYGSVIRSLAPGVTTTGSMTAVAASSNSKVHLHGTGIDVVANDNRDVFALVADTGALIHANEVSYFLSAATGNVTRIANNGGNVRAPYLWNEQPTAPNISSVTGADMAVVTSTPDGQPHLLIYSANCSSGWFDTVTSQCH